MLLAAYGLILHGSHAAAECLESTSNRWRRCDRPDYRRARCRGGLRGPTTARYRYRATCACGDDLRCNGLLSGNDNGDWRQRQARPRRG